MAKPKSDVCACCGRAKLVGGTCAKCGHPHCEKHGAYSRQALSLSDPAPRPWTAHEKYMLYARGFGDGAKCSAIKHDGFAAYMRGYVDGQRASRDAISKYAAEIGFAPTILRLADEPAPKCRGCPHKPHLGPCQRRSGTTAYACGCQLDTIPEVR